MSSWQNLAKNGENTSPRNTESSCSGFSVQLILMRLTSATLKPSIILKEDSELTKDIIDFLYMAALPKVSDKHRKFMVDVFGTDSIEDMRQKVEKFDWNYVDEKIGSYLCGDDAEIREIADDVEMFVHARYTVR